MGSGFFAKESIYSNEVRSLTGRLFHVSESDVSVLGPDGQR